VTSETQENKCAKMTVVYQVLLLLPLVWTVAHAVNGSLSNQATTFSLEAVQVQPEGGWNVPASMRKTYLKYGKTVPDYIETAVSARQLPPQQGSTGVHGVLGDMEFVIDIEVGKQNLSVLLDSGSSDL
jgi:hypothetical protein